MSRCCNTIDLARGSYVNGLEETSNSKTNKPPKTYTQQSTRNRSGREAKPVEKFRASYVEWVAPNHSDPTFQELTNGKAT